MTSPVALGLLAAVALAAGGCAGARPHVTLETCRYPVSMTAWVLDPEGNPVALESLEKVGTLASYDRGWSIGWTIIPLNSVDLSEDVNSQVEMAGGEAVVNFRLTAELPPAPDMFPGMFLFHWVPVWPGSVGVEATGDIVRRRGIHPPIPRVPAPAPAPAAEDDE